jgi:hypothetical protein
VVDDEPDVAELFRQRFRREARQGTYVMYFAAWGEPWSSSKEHIVKQYMASLPWSPLMPEIVVDPPSPSCSHLFPGPRIQESQILSPDPFRPRSNQFPKSTTQASSFSSTAVIAQGEASRPLTARTQRC